MSHTRFLFGFLAMGGFLLWQPSSVSAAGATLMFRYEHHLFEIPARTLSLVREEKDVWTFHGRTFTPPASLQVDGDILPALPAGVERQREAVWSADALKGLLATRIALPLDREPGTVTIRSSGSGGYAFDGVGFPGRRVDIDALAVLAAEALRNGTSDVVIPIIETPPTVTVLDPALANAGIKELVALGESSFHGSPQNRRHNITVGLNRFNGHRIKQGETFSFVEVLGDVDGSTGYRKELVIKGDRTVPDYGGGLCQVSSTAYRGVWEYGFPIAERRNHSYIVSYYGPVGTDATTYLPKPDFRFTNDSPGDLLIQTYMDNDHDEAFFLYYGTKDERTTDVAGPYIWDRTSPPPPRTEVTTDLAPGQTKVLGHAVPGLKAAWFRMVKKGDEETVENFTSIYGARPDFTQIGGDPNQVPAGEEPPSPTDIPPPSFFPVD